MPEPPYPLDTERFRDNRTYGIPIESERVPGAPPGLLGTLRIFIYGRAARAGPVTGLAICFCRVVLDPDL